MPISEVKAKIKTLVTINTDEFGSLEASAKDIPGQDFENIKAIKFIFLDNELQDLDIEYEISKNVLPIAELSKKFSGILTIPEKSWVNVTMLQGGGYAIAKCYGFDSQVSSFNFENGQRTVLQLNSTNYKQTLLLRTVIKREKERQTKETSDN